MQIKNFIINPDFISLNYQDQYFDLHNNFELTDTTYNNEEKVVRLIFTKSNGDWVPKNNPKSLTLLFTNVARVYYKDHDIDYPAEHIAQDELTINMLCFSFDSNEIMDGVTDNVSRQDLPALLFVLETGKAIKIMAESVELFLE